MPVNISPEKINMISLARRLMNYTEISSKLAVHDTLCNVSPTKFKESCDKVSSFLKQAASTEEDIIEIIEKSI